MMKCPSSANVISTLAREVANQWKELSEEDKAPFEEQASVNRSRYRVQLAEWKLQQERGRNRAGSSDSLTLEECSDSHHASLAPTLSQPPSPSVRSWQEVAFHNVAPSKEHESDIYPGHKHQNPWYADFSMADSFRLQDLEPTPLWEPGYGSAGLFDFDPLGMMLPTQSNPHWQTPKEVQEMPNTNRASYVANLMRQLEPEEIQHVLGVAMSSEQYI